MSTCEQINEMIVEALYGELDDKQTAKLKNHLRSCPDCARLYKQTAETMRVMDARETSERDESFWTDYSQRLAARLDAQESESRQSIRQGRFFQHIGMRFGAIAALVLVGIFLGKLIWTEEHQSEPAPQPPQTNTVEERTQAYLEKSKVLLLALDNFDPQTDDAATLNLQSQRRISESLVQEAAFLKPALADPAETHLRELVDDLEIILLQIANLEDEHDLEAVQMVQKGVDTQAVLFRIDLSKISNNNSNSSTNTKQDKRNQIQI